MFTSRVLQRRPTGIFLANKVPFADDSSLPIVPRWGGALGNVEGETL